MEMIKLLAQILFDLLIKNPVDTRFGRLMNWALGNLRYLMIHLGDPLVYYDQYKTRLWLPLSHDLPLIQKIHPVYSTNVGRIANQVIRKYPSLKFVDIGANIGDTVAILRCYSDFPILCIEGSQEYFRILEKNTAQLKDIYRNNSFVGNINDSIDAVFIANQGTARLTTGKNKIVVRKLGNILEDFPGFENSKMIKVDTDGMDAMILSGAMDVIDQAHPVLFFEYYPYLFEKHGDDGLSLFIDLKKTGYKTIIVYDNYGD